MKYSSKKSSELLLITVHLLSYISFLTLYTYICIYFIIKATFAHWTSGILRLFTQVLSARVTFTLLLSIICHTAAMNEICSCFTSPLILNRIRVAEKFFLTLFFLFQFEEIKSDSFKKPRRRPAREENRVRIPPRPAPPRFGIGSRNRHHNFGSTHLRPAKLLLIRPVCRVWTGNPPVSRFTSAELKKGGLLGPVQFSSAFHLDPVQTHDPDIMTNDTNTVLL